MIRFGILGPGKISHRFVKGMMDVEDACIVAVASREETKAQEYSKQYSIPKAYGNYEAMLSDSDVDAVYIATPPFLHVEQIKMCLNAGKHVLCEKPLMKTSEEARECFALAKEKGLLLMEATKGVFTPTYLKIKEIVDSGELGKISYVEGSYCYNGGFDASHWVNQQELAGGGMYDVGIYPLSAIICLFEPKIVDVKRLDTVSGNCLGFTQLMLKYADEKIASVRGAITVATQNKLFIYGEKGYLESEFFWKTHDFRLVLDGKVIDYHFDFNSEFTFEIQHFVDCIKKGLVESPVLSEEMSCLMLDLMDESNY